MWKRKQRPEDTTQGLGNGSVYQLISRFADCLLRQDPSISNLVRPLDRQLIQTLKSILISQTPEQWERSIEKQLGSDRTLVDFVINYLHYIAGVELINEGDTTQTPDLHDANFDLLLNVYNPAANIFRRADAAFFTIPIQLLSHALVNLAITADRSKQSNKNEKAGEAARQMTTTLGISCIDRSPEEPSKRRAAFSLANGLFKIYFFLNNMRLCDTVLKNTSNVIDQLETHYPKSEMVTFYFYLGRLSLYQRRLHEAQHSLRIAFDLCKTESWKNRRLILIYLIAASLPLGILPVQELLVHFSLHEQFGPVVQSLRTGNWPMLAHALDVNMEWFRYRGVYILLREKLEVICWRNFFVIAAGLRNGRRGMRLSSLTCVQIARKIFMEDTIDAQDIESMACSLIDQGYLKAYVKLGEMIVFGPTLPQIRNVGLHLAESHPARPALTHSGITSAPMSAQNSQDMPSKSNTGFSIKGAGKLQDAKRFS
ncbi:hypothetical protein CROQUDRAFT_672396 [Cronartium quercuum f. sp. fusiforme G11]|uniref:PCI domain-containing protein n=1 Tax=Cronartium quercuum f. sp. fusiforme G11 TaxID=708437 RepID=A0A9P6NHR4_9BASI|nr:hypothetical protein CROQUDRAFT_672396 [Cronartium quercuum f. sp. fusiforme G11]